VNKLNDLHYFLYNTGMCFITETWLHDGISSGVLDPKCEFTVLRKDRTMSKGGGVCALINKCFRIIPVDIHADYDDLEMYCFDLIVSSTRLRFFVLYRAPSYDGETLSYVCKLVKCLSRFHSSKYPNILLGDINFPKLNLINYCGPSDNIHQKFFVFCDSV